MNFKNNIYEEKYLRTSSKNDASKETIRGQKGFEN